MGITRIMTVGGHRIGNACLSLQFDHNLPKFDQTIVVTSMDTIRLKSIFENYGIDTSSFVWYRDHEIIELHAEINNWQLTGETRGRWLVQQAIKLVCIDMCETEQIFIHDPDSFCYKPYDPFPKFDQLNLFCLFNQTQPYGYYEAFVNATGLPRQSDLCFICDMQPVLKSDWVALKQHIIERSNKSWLDSIIDACPWDYLQNLKWFSEYEFLANWHVHLHSDAVFTPQTRLDYYRIEDILDRPVPECNTITDKNPHNNILKFDFASGKVFYLDAVVKHLRAANH